MCAASRSWKRKGYVFSSRVYRKEYRPADTLLLLLCYGLNICILRTLPLNTYVEILTHKVTLFGDRLCGEVIELK